MHTHIRQKAVKGRRENNFSFHLANELTFKGAEEPKIRQRKLSGFYPVLVAYRKKESRNRDFKNCILEKLSSFFSPNNGLRAGERSSSS